MVNYEIKVVIIGNSASGKTSLRRRYLGDKFTNSYIATVGADFSVNRMTIDGNEIRVAIWDIAGQDEYHTLVESYYHGAHGALVVYDITNKKSFDDVTHWIEKFVAYSNTSICGPIILIGNKIDLQSEECINEFDHLKKVQELAHKFPEVPILAIRTSALTGENVNHAFASLISHILEFYHRSKQNGNDKVHKDLTIWDFTEKYMLVDIISCRNCGYYIEADEHVLYCPHCDKILIVSDKKQAYVLRERK